MAIAKVFSILLTFALAIGAQPSLRSWANAEEYDLGSQALAEPDAKQRIALLRDWLTLYPKSTFERERLISFALSFQHIGDPREWTEVGYRGPRFERERPEYSAPHRGLGANAASCIG